MSANNLWRDHDFHKLWSAQTIPMLGSSSSFPALPMIVVMLSLTWGRMSVTIRFIAARLIVVGGLVGGALGVWLGPQGTLIVAAVGELLVALWVVGLGERWMSEILPGK